jgi:hypothetical protein
MPRGEPSAFEAPPDSHSGRTNGFDNAATWDDPDLGVLQLQRRTPPPLPIDVFGPIWADWMGRRPKRPIVRPIMSPRRCSPQHRL